MFSIALGVNETPWWLYTLRTEDGCYTLIMCKVLLFKLGLQRPSGTGLPCRTMREEGPARRWCVPHQHPDGKRTHQKNLDTMSACDIQDAFSRRRGQATAFVMLRSSASVWQRWWYLPGVTQS